MDLLFDQYIGKNAFNVQSDFEHLFPAYQIVLLHANTYISWNFRLDRIKIVHDDNNVILNITIG